MPAAVVLAAGASTRLGSPKALVSVGGEAAVARIVRLLRGAGVSSIVVVTGPHDAEIRAVAPAGAQVVRNDAWQRGRSGSLQCGLKALGEPQRVLIWPVDHPAVDAATVRALVAGPGPIRIPTHAGSRGHPIVVDAEVWPELFTLGPDEPLRAVVHKDPARIVDVPVPDPGIHVNGDRPEDVARLARVKPLGENL